MPTVLFQQLTIINVRDNALTLNNEVMQPHILAGNEVIQRVIATVPITISTKAYN
jgi:hypothetical protein